MITENVEETDKTEGKHDVSTEAKQNGDEKTEEKHDAVEANKYRKTEGKRDALTEAKQNGDEKTEEKHDAVEANKDHDEKTEEKREVSVSEEATVNVKCDVTTPAENEGNEEKESKNVMKHDDSCSSRSERIINMNKNDNSDIYDSETEDTTDSSSHENYITISKKSSHSDNADVIPEVKCDRKSIELIDLVSTSSSEENKKIQRDIEIDSDVQEIKQTTDKRDVKTKAVQDVDDEKHERPDSPDSSTIKMSQKWCAIVDKVPQIRAETRSQYRCNLARKFIKTDYRYKSPNVGPELDFFEDDEGDESYNSDTTYKTPSMTATSTNSCDNDSDDNSNSNEESVLYVTISFHVHYLSALLIHKVNYITIYLCNAFFT